MPPIRARDLRENIKAMGFEKGVVHTLELMLDAQVELRQHILAVTELCDKCIDELGKLIHVGGEMRKVIDTIKRERQQGDEHDGDDR
jgi:hypothetical protein